MEYSTKHEKKADCLVQQPHPFPSFEIDMLASRKPPFAPLRPLHAKIPSSPCPSFVYLPVSSSRLLAFSSLSSASVCTGVSDSNGLTRVSRSREYQLLFPRRTTPMNNAFPGEIDMQIAECTVDTV